MATLALFDHTVSSAAPVRMQESLLANAKRA